MTTQSDPWVRVAEEVQRRRLQLNLTQEEAARRSDGRISRATWQKVESALGQSYSARTVMGICRALGWTDDSIHRVMKELPPIEVESEEQVDSRIQSLAEWAREDPSLDDSARRVLLDVYRSLLRQVSQRR